MYGTMNLQSTLHALLTWEVDGLGDNHHTIQRGVRVDGVYCCYISDTVFNCCIDRNATMLVPLPHSWLWLPVDFMNSLRPRQNRCQFADDIFKCIFLNENILMSIKISLKFVLRGTMNNIPALVQIMAWHIPGNKLLSEPMMIILLTHICIIRHQWVNGCRRLLQSMVDKHLCFVNPGRI